MNGTVSFAYVNRKYFDNKGTKARLNVDCSNSASKDKDGNKKYVNYSLTLWEDDAIYWNEKITGNKEDKQCVSFNGYITEVSAKEHNGKLYTTVQIALTKAGKTAAFFLLPNLSASEDNSAISEIDF